MLIFEQLAENRIIDAIAHGEFNDLPGSGKPLEMEDLSLVPEEIRMAYKVLKNAGMTPPELELKNEVTQLHRSLETETDDTKRQRSLRRLQYLYISLDISSQRYTNLALQHQYYEKLLNRFSKS